MKRIMIIVALLSICSCAPRSQPPSTQETYLPSIEAFSINQQCQNLCWLSIQPKETTYDDAIKIINNSTEIKLDATEVTANTIDTYWFLEKTQTLETPVRISFSNNLVEKIEFKKLLIFTTNDFLDVLGQPDEISLIVHNGVHGEKYIVYHLYYTDPKISLQAKAIGDQGPSPNDYVNQLIANDEAEDIYRQPWLGYGHIDQYLLITIPSPTPFQ